MTLRVTTIAFSWLALICFAHYWLNTEHSNRQQVTIGYMPVIANLAAPLLDHASKDGTGTRFKALKFGSFAEIAESLRNGNIDAAFIIAPLSIVLKQQGVDVKVIYIGNRHESTLVARKNLQIHSFADLSGKTVAVPMRYSGHNLSILELIEKSNLKGKIKVVEMNPPDMASALSAGTLDAYYVGEPFAAQTLMSGDSQLVHHVEDVWENFIGNLAITRQDYINEHPELVQQLVESAARSGMWAQQHQKQASKIAAEYWGQSAQLVDYVMNTPSQRIQFDQFIPKQDEMQHITNLMLHFELVKTNYIEGLVDDRFALKANLENIGELSTILSSSNNTADNHSGALLSKK